MDGPESTRRCHELAEEHGLVSLGRMRSQDWRDDPKHVGFTLARYKFVSKMVNGCDVVAEIGAGDGWASEIVRREVKWLDLYDLDVELGQGVVKSHDILATPLPRRYDAIFALDLIEHLADGPTFLKNVKDSLFSNGLFVVGAPSLESQVHASSLSKIGHVACRSGSELRDLCGLYFEHVFMFGMNDEMVHVGFLPMAHYLLALCVRPRGERAPHPR